MKSVLGWTSLFVSSALLTISASAYSVVDEGIEKGNGTLPVRMEGELRNTFGERIGIESHICAMVLRDRTAISFSTQCYLRGPAVKSFSVDGVVRLQNRTEDTYRIVEVCEDLEEGTIEIILGRNDSKPLRFEGKTRQALGDIVGIEGTVQPGDWSFRLYSSDAEGETLEGDE